MTTSATVSAQQQAAEDRPHVEPTEAATDETADHAIRFKLRGLIGITEGFDNNIFATEFEEQHDFITIISPTVSASSKWTHLELNYGASADVYRYQDFDNEDAEDWRLFIDGRSDVSESTNLFGGFSHAKNHEQRSSPNDVLGIRPTTFEIYEVFGGYAVDDDWFSLRFGATHADYDYDDVATLAGSVNNDDRDREQSSVGLRVGLPYSDKHEMFAQIAYDDRRYILDVDDNGFMRDSDGYRLALGVTSALEQVESEVLAGFLRQKYDDPRFGTIREPDVGIRISTKGRPWRLSGYLDRTLEETTLAEASGYLSTRLGLGYRQDINLRTTLSVALGYIWEDFQGTDRLDEIASVGAGLGYRLTPGWRFQADLERAARYSNAEFADYIRTRLFFRVVGDTNTTPIP
ncbi:MAG: outer membrane beta-barrel protein, partial [Gammaproteobacteria bacterium]|nr:outer membrane beta-barrel protein [Gammaproteobacteria bacterium]